MRNLEVVLADDHQMFRDGIKSVLNEEAGISVVGEVGNGNELMTLLSKSQPDLVITDISMPGISGIEVSKMIKSSYPTVKVLILSMHTNEEFITKAIDIGADGYLPKDTSMKELLEAIRVISHGESYFNKSISDTIIKSMINKSKSKQVAGKKASLTNREIEIVLLVVDGLTNKEIAEKLFISVRTVDSHKNNIMQKLHLKSSVDLVKYAIRNKMVNLYD